jgi:hypothetical protein
VAEEVAVAADRSRQGPHVNDLTVDIGDLSDGAGGTRADDDPGTLTDARRVGCLVDEAQGSPVSSSELRSSTRSIGTSLTARQP